MTSTPTGRTAITAPGIIARVLAVAREGVGDEAVIPRIPHRGVEEAVDDKRAGLLVHLVLDRFAADLHLDHDVDLVGWVLADRDCLEAHG
jgi:hypothetical protein